MRNGVSSEQPCNITQATIWRIKLNIAADAIKKETNMPGARAIAHIVFNGLLSAVCRGNKAFNIHYRGSF
ncbi:hypothetical protein QMT25_00710 [Cronobacter dublinensis]|uniref:hypothetical protein n=1 Tax=Cronobacter dublinensis TaxID=413497 RepID=UPI0024C40F3D|nr:hypothetical protein [Cronobacter dublinensis]MDK1195485.1 hypothetical protein [Cronobacter dublinensis]